MTESFTTKQRLQQRPGGQKQKLHPNSLANLKPFPKGVASNPKGRPHKDVSLTSLLKEEIQQIPEGEKEGRTWRQILVLAWLRGALTSAPLLKEMLERLEGKVLQPVSGADGEPIRIEHVIIHGGTYHAAEATTIAETSGKEED